jgi:hypothetical protein
VPPSLLELQRRTQDNLISFLRIEAQLAFAFCDIAQRTQSAEHRAKVLRDIRHAANAMHHFGERITDLSVRNDVLKQAAKIEKFLAKNSK